ncbi:TadE/TadG family type IV pilus assembly protein [Lichenihabitans sp. Uapishka_5]|uniref:TadE/TadG family type IV pilus assembly protein n=1 Tax=Lichenihabitans sp. Uapishka_5 TaxID=3037302 RepID=UPI0029E8237E|nr:TadE/TadG family type IV pilus assembly protein [Lichenihabitans sp. Uapishka_5]MDX7951723.1 TadE/TadG family type IV pilus assembly protein [Lichenihabitans sp. Uapishka_5]
MRRGADPAPSNTGPDPAGPEAGAAILEFALVLPILLALLGGAFEFGRVLLVRHAMIEGVRGGARYLARLPDPRCEAGICAPGVARAVAIARDTIVGLTGIAPTALAILPEARPDAATVTMRANLSLDVDLLRFTGLGPRISVTAVDEEARIGE